MVEVIEDQLLKTKEQKLQNIPVITCLLIILNNSLQYFIASNKLVFQILRTIDEGEE